MAVSVIYGIPQKKKLSFQRYMYIMCGFSVYSYRFTKTVFFFPRMWKG